MRAISSLGEFDWLKKLLPRLYWPSSYSQLCIGPGDDAGVLRINPHRVLVATTDAMVEGIHFESKWFSWEDLGEKVLAVNLSDLAAMGEVKSLAALVTVAFPGDTPVNSVDKFYQGLDKCAKRWKTGFLGGDTVGSPKGWFVSVTLLGEANLDHLISRKGAKEGDYLAITGPLGHAAAGLEVLQKRKTDWGWTKPLVKAFCHPQPRLRIGGILGRQRLASSLIDSSDGLEASVRLLAEASGLGARIDLAEIPVSPALQRWSQYAQRSPEDYVLSGGEDYELVFTVSPTRWSQLQRQLPQVIRIGQMRPRLEGCWAIHNQREIPLKGYGFRHFN